MQLKNEVMKLKAEIEKARRAPLLQKAAAVELVVVQAGNILGEACARIERLEEVLNNGQ